MSRCRMPKPTRKAVRPSVVLAAGLLAGAVAAAASVHQTPARASDSCPLAHPMQATCGVLVGSTGNLEGVETTLAQSLARQEGAIGRKLDIVHTYHTGAQDFPTPQEVAIATDTSNDRLLFLNWKPENGSTWAEVAAGRQDVAIDALAERITQRMPYVPFYFACHHEPEEEVRGQGSGFTAADYVAMCRRVIQRLGPKTNWAAQVVWNMMGYEKWGNQGMYDQLWLGDDVVQWIAMDKYAQKGVPLRSIVDSHDSPAFPGFYTWATTKHPGKPIMLAEYGASGTPAERASAVSSLPGDLRGLPAIKAVVFFNHTVDGVTNGMNYSFDDDPSVSAAARRALNDPYLNTRALG